MATAFVLPRGSTGRVPSTSSSRARASLTPSAPLPAQEADGRRWGCVAAPFCAAAATLAGRRRPLRAEASKAPAVATEAKKGFLPQRAAPWMVAALGLFVVLLHRVALKEFRQFVPPPRFIVFLHTVVFLVVSQLMPPQKWPNEQNFRVVTLVAVLEFLGWAGLQQVAFAGGLGVTAALLNGVSLLLTLLCARFVLGSRVRPTAWLGAVIVAVGVGLTGSMTNLLFPGIGLPQFALLGASLSFSSLAITVKEVLFSGRAPLSVPAVACLASFSQLLALALPELLSLRSFPGSLQFVQIIVGPAPRILSLAWPAYLYIAASAVLRLTFTWGLKAANSPTVQLVNAIAVPCGTALLTLLSPYGHLTGRTLAALAVTLAGSAVFFQGGSPSIKSSALFATTLTPEELKEEEEWKKADADRAIQLEKAKKESAEKRKQSEEDRKKQEEEKTKSAEEQRQLRMEREEAKKQEEAQKQRQREEEKRAREEAKQKAQAEKKRLQEERKAKKEAERKEREEAKRKAEEERKKKQAEYEAQKKEEQRLAVEERKRKEAEEKQRKEAEQQRKEEEARQKQEAKQREAEERKQRDKEKKEAEEKKRAEQAAAKAETERLQKEEQEKKAAEQRQKKEEEERQRQQAEAERKHQEAEAEALRQKQEAERKQQEEEVRKRQEEEARQRQQAEERQRQEEEERKRQEEERKRLEEEERKRQEEQLRKQKEEDERKRQEQELQRQQEEESRRKAAEERRKQEQEQEAVAESKPISEEERLAQEKAKKEEQKRYSRLSFKWRMQDESRLKDEVSRVKEQVEKRQAELAALLAQKEEEEAQYQQRQLQLQAEERRIENEKKAKAPALQGLSKQGGGGQDSKKG